MRTVTLSDGTTVPAVGQGTWMMGEARRRMEELGALRAGIDRGMTLIDTAEMYGDGTAERLVAEAIAGRRDEVFLVSKVLPSNARTARLVRSCEESLKRLGTDRLDLYLLHWRGSTPLDETIAAFDRLREAGKILRWGVSNFDTEDMEELFLVNGGEACITNQVLYNPENRGAEFDLLPWQEARGIVTMAYSPVGQGGSLLKSAALAEVARRHGATPGQIAIAWSIREGDVISIPKAARLVHVEENAAAADIVLTEEDLDTLDAAHPPPRTKTPLAMS